MFSFFKNIFSSKKNDSIVIEEEKFETPISITDKNELEIVKPKTQEDLEEAVIENWWIKQNKPLYVNHYDLIYSGINMDRFSNLEAKVGKFTFKRAYFGDNWTITIEEKKITMDTLDESLQDAEVLKSIIKKTIKGICEKGKLYPNICSYASRSTMDEEEIITKVFNHMMAEVLPMELTPAINLVDLELGGGFGS